MTVIAMTMTTIDKIMMALIMMLSVMMMMVMTMMVTLMLIVVIVMVVMVVMMMIFYEYDADDVSGDGVAAHSDDDHYEYMLLFVILFSHHCDCAKIQSRRCRIRRWGKAN